MIYAIWCCRAAKAALFELQAASFKPQAKLVAFPASMANMAFVED
ncbi:hypothetical protein QWZ13_16740 [Reinekea marina]|nr:hypothetical protein [Reinekea marina]MDN3650555.1 hypothetical protein [Reinekea marina]